VYGGPQGISLPIKEIAMTRKFAPLIAAVALAVLIIGAVSAEASGSRSVPTSSLAQPGPNVRVWIDTSKNARVLKGGSEAILVYGLNYRCSGFFLPVQPIQLLTEPSSLKVWVYQGDQNNNNITEGFVNSYTPYCDGVTHTRTLTVPVTGGSGNGFFPGTAFVELQLNVCDFTGCQSDDTTKNVGVR
jgi:hypothetical protein